MKYDESNVGNQSYDYTNGFIKDSFIDAHDKQKWCVAIILSSTSETVNIRFEAWSSRYDEKGISKHSKRLAPFRLHSIGYTGQKIQAYRKFTYTKQLNTEKSNTILKLSSFNSMDPYNFTQILRGDIFFYADSLLSLSYNYGPISEDLEDISTFFESYYRLVLCWIKHFPKVRKEYLAAKCNKFLYLTDFNTAVAVAYPELSATLSTSFGGDWERIEKSFIVNYL